MLKASVVVLSARSRQQTYLRNNADSHRECTRRNDSVGNEGIHRTVAYVRHAGTGEEASCRVVYLSPHQAEKREVGVDFIKPSPGFWRISFRHLTGQTEVPKQKKPQDPAVRRANPRSRNRASLPRRCV